MGSAQQPKVTCQHSNNGTAVLGKETCLIVSAYKLAQLDGAQPHCRSSKGTDADLRDLLSGAACACNSHEPIASYSNGHQMLMFSITKVWHGHGGCWHLSPDIREYAIQIQTSCSRLRW
eukprot:GHUV01010447.1.p2 GENE.GHUV01010447.1~~GHUV01010447.1.p2  ORF type:complete len:119 (+),score=8.87 GHUV01010447.1:2446-2802(+)